MKTVEIMLKNVQFKKKKDMIRMFRILIDCYLEIRKNVKILLCSEMEYKMFEIFMEPIVILIVYHRNELLNIEISVSK
jgi:hypothetical protein